MWFIAFEKLDNVFNYPDAVYTVLGASLDGLPCPWGSEPCTTVICGKAKGSRRHCNQLYNVLQTQLSLGHNVVLLTKSSCDPVHKFSTWHEFQKSATLPHMFSNHNSTEITPIAQLFYELGDHADDEIAAVSATRRKAIPIEAHYDDCGDNTDPLVLPELTTFANCFSDSSSESSDDCNDFDGNFYCSHFYGSDSECDCQDSFTHAFTTIETWPQKSSVDYCEVFGGNGGTTKVAIRRCLKGGRNYDITSGINLLDHKEVALLFLYLGKAKPLVVVMGPPCTAFGQWSAWNQIHNYEGWFQSMLTGLPLAKLAARIAVFQDESGRYFLCENPWLSKLWSLACWLSVLSRSRVCFSYLDQCAYGLTTIDKEPTMKPTCFVANHLALLFYLRRTCNGMHIHIHLAGSSQGISRTKYAQTWPVQLCDSIVKGILLLKRQLMYIAFPAVSSAVCGACKQNASSDDNRHIREGNCRFPNAVPANWLCPACTQHKHSKHNEHSHIPGECKWASVVPRAGGVRNSAPRGPRIQASSLDEALPGVDETTDQPPPPTTIGNWWPVKSLQDNADLEHLRGTVGWSVLGEAVVLVLLHARYIRTLHPYN